MILVQHAQSKSYFKCKGSCTCKHFENIFQVKKGNNSLKQMSDKNVVIICECSYGKIVKNHSKLRQDCVHMVRLLSHLKLGQDCGHMVRLLNHLKLGQDCALKFVDVIFDIRPINILQRSANFLKSMQSFQELPGRMEEELRIYTFVKAGQDKNNMFRQTSLVIVVLISTLSMPSSAAQASSMFQPILQSLGHYVNQDNYPIHKK